MDGDPNNKASEALSIKYQFSTLSVDDDDDGDESSVKDGNAEKEPVEKLSTNSPESSTSEAESRRELYEMIVPSALRESWIDSERPVCLNFYFVKFIPRPEDRLYKEFGIFLKASLPREAEGLKVLLQLHGGGGRTVEAELVPSGVVNFDEDEIQEAQKFHQMCLKAILHREEFISEFVSLENNNLSNSSSTRFYLLLPVILRESNRKVDWELIRRCLSSPIFRTQDDAGDRATPHLNNHLQLANGPKSIEDVVNSLVYIPSPGRKGFYFVSEVIWEKKRSTSVPATGLRTHVFVKFIHHLFYRFTSWFSSHLSYPDQPLLKAKNLFRLKNLLCKRGNPESREKEEHFLNLRPEICQLKIIGFSKDIGSSLSLLPSIMHRLESLLVAVELKQVLSSSFPEGAEVTAYRVLEALTTEKCNEGFSYERLEVLGDVFLKFVVGRHLFLLDSNLKEGELTQKRKDIVENSNLFKLATMSNLQLYIRDQSFDPCQFFALGHPCSGICSRETESTKHSPCKSDVKNSANAEVRCNKNHHWLQNKTIADVVEALIGAFIVDSGFKAATAFLKWFGIQVDFKVLQVINICSESKKFMQFDARLSIADLENLSGYRFRHKGLLLEAFVHPSLRDQVGGCYQRLEYLGDAVLDYLVTSYLYSVYPKLNPGQFTVLRSEFVKNKILADVAVQHSLHEKLISKSSGLEESIDKYINLPASEKGQVKSPKALADLVESFIGAILLDTGFDLSRVWKIMLSFLNPDMILSRLKAQGYKLEPKSLEEVLESSCKMEAKLIGYDETLIDTIASDAAEFNTMKLEESSSEATAVCCSSGSQHAGGSQKGSAESHLYKICNDNCWKPPVFECHEEMGPNHLNEFTSKVVVEIEKSSDVILECYGEPRAKKEDAREHAAEGAVWYLKHEGTCL
ncbi:dicer-like protein 4 isoform X2 [Cornus florida]|uniref:dicer-like protein 4 isoform X2 n=1 Tax=Cornus florida TaxID=4283 RepID=UPI00289D09B1|nr:dicer-like protein 4 isoform X2 [Cornus florida]